MTIKTKKVKQYNSTYKYVIMIDEDVVCLCRGQKQCLDCIRYLMNGGPKLKDGKIMKELDKYRTPENIGSPHTTSIERDEAEG